MLSRRPVRAALLMGLGLALGFAAACTMPSLDATGKTCPCPDGYVCDAKTSTCLRGAGSSTSSASSASSAGSSSSSSSGAGGSSSSSSSSSGSAGASSSSGALCAGLCGTPGCGTCPKEPVVQVDTFDVDATEVTRAAYQAFLDAHVDPSKQQPLCLWNKDFSVLQTGDQSTGCNLKFDPVTFPQRPVTCIDWCDAAAFCAWTGRHLCGRIGGGKLQDSEAGDPAKSQWHHACTQAGMHAYPYGDTYDPMKCNTLGGGHGGVPVDTGSLPDCAGGYPGIFDMSGNVEEWEDACGTGVDPNDPTDDDCPVRGGAYWTDVGDSRCDGLKYYPRRDGQSADWGFRCCGK